MKRLVYFLILFCLPWTNMLASNVSPHFKHPSRKGIFTSILEKRLNRAFKYSLKVVSPFENTCGACDTIILKDGRIVVADIQRVTLEGVFFQKCGEQNDKEYMMPAENIEQIRYRNGTSKIFRTEDTIMPQQAIRGIKRSNLPKEIEHKATNLYRGSIATVLTGFLAFIALYFLWDLLVILIPATLVGGLITIIGGVILNSKAESISDKEFRKKVKLKIKKAMLLLLILPLAVILAVKVGLEI